jgi:hypothetical protein
MERAAIIARANGTDRKVNLGWGFFIIFLVSSFAFPYRTGWAGVLAGESSHFLNSRFSERATLCGRFERVKGAVVETLWQDASAGRGPSKLRINKPRPYK